MVSCEVRDTYQIPVGGAASSSASEGISDGSV